MEPWTTGRDEWYWTSGEYQVCKMLGLDGAKYLCSHMKKSISFGHEPFPTLQAAFDFCEEHHATQQELHAE